MSGYSFEIHHVLGKNFHNLFGDQMDILFGGPEHNPFHPEAVSNKIALANNAAMADAIAALDTSGNQVFSEIGFGHNVHDGFHPNFDSFQELAGDEIFNNGLNPEQQKAALNDLDEYSRALSKSGQPPIPDATPQELLDGWKSQLPDGDVGKAIDKPENALSLAEKQASWDNTAPNDRLIDADGVNNNEARQQVAKSFIEKALNSNSIHEDLKSTYQDRLSLIEKGEVGHGKILDWGTQAWTELSKAAGIGDDNGALSDLDPNNIVPQEPTRPSQDRLDRYSRELDLKKAYGDAADRAKNIPDGANPKMLDTVPGAQQTYNQLKDAVDQGDTKSNPNTGTKFAGDDVIKSIDKSIDAADKFLGDASRATTLSDFTNKTNNLVDHFKDLNRGVGEALDKVPGGKYLAFAGSFGDFYEFVSAAGKAIDQYQAGDTDAAIHTLTKAAASFVLSTAASLVAGMAAVSLGLAGWPVVAAAFAAGIAAGILADQLEPGWQDDLQAIFDWRLIDPLVIDLDGDGVELTSLASSDARFDLDEDGFAENTGWVSPDDALLVFDANLNGKIDDISELFGSDTESGFDVLSQHDDNGDGRIDAADAAYHVLSLWQDTNSNGLTDAGELSSLANSGVSAINLNSTETAEQVNGNLIVEKATVEFANGNVNEVGEVLFDLSQVETTYLLPEGFIYDEDALKRPTLPGFGEIPDLWVATTNDVTLRQDSDELITEFRNGDLTQFYDGFDDFLAKWAGVSDVQWAQDIPNLVAYLAYDADAYEAWRIEDEKVYVNTTPPPNPWPIIRGLIYIDPDDDAFMQRVHNDDDDIVSDWLAEQGFAAPGYVAQSLNGISTGNPPLPYSASINPDFELHYDFSSVSVGGGGPITIEPGEATLAIIEEPEPAIPAPWMGFLQKLMGQELNPPGQVLASELVVTSRPTPEQVADLYNSFGEVQDYMMARFLSQATYSVFQTEGENADLGLLALFEDVAWNPTTDNVIGLDDDLVSRVISHFRDNGGTDVEALQLLSVFHGDWPHLPAVIIDTFPNIDRSLVQSILPHDPVTEGTQGADDVSRDSNGFILGFDGDDTISAGDAKITVIGGDGDDVINGGDGVQTYVYHVGDGNDVITDINYSSEKDRLVLADADYYETGFNQNGDQDLVITFSSGETITVVDHFANTGCDIEEIALADGSILDAQAIRDKSVADQKADGATVLGSRYNENYHHAQGDGSYTISDVSYNSNHDTLALIDAIASEVTFSVGQNDDLIITLPNGETITVAGHFASHVNGVEQITFADGSSLDEQGIRDKSVADQKAEGATIVGTTSDENYYHAQGDGSYTITDTSYNSDNDTLHLTDANAADVTFAISPEENLIVTLPNGETITVIDHFRDKQFSAGPSNHVYDIENIQFADGTLFSAQNVLDKLLVDHASAQISSGDDNIIGTYFSDHLDGGAGNDTIDGGVRSDTIIGGAGDDSINGGDGADTYVYNLGDGNDTITEINFSAEQDRLHLADINESDATFTQNAGLDLVITMSNGESVTVTGHFENTGNDVELIEFADGSVLNSQGTRDKSVADQKADGATVVGSRYDENYQHTLGDGSYKITDISFNSDQDKLTFTDANSDDVSFGQNTNQDLVITLSNGEIITVSEHFADNVNDIETIEFADGVILNAQGIRDKSVADQKTDGATITGSRFNENYHHTQGDGSYTISDTSFNSDNDTLYFTDVNEADVTFAISPEENLVITLTNGETITVLDHFKDKQFSAGPSNHVYDIENIQFADGTVFNTQDILDKLLVDHAAAQITSGDDNITGTYFAEVLDGGAGNDTIDGGVRNDTLIGGAGDDSLDGGDGADTYIYHLGDGNDVITDIDAAGVLDRLTFADVNENDVFFAQNATQDLVITLSNGETVTVSGHFAHHHNDIEQIEFADGTVLDLQGIRDKAAADGIAIQVSAGDDAITGSAFDEVINAGDGNDTIDGGDGDDSYLGGNGDDLLISSAGSDTFDGGDGVDTLDLSSATDDAAIDLNAGSATFANGDVEAVTNIENVIAGSGNNMITGSDVANILTGNGGNDTLEGSAGSDTYVYVLGDGSDVIRDSAVGGGDDLLRLVGLNVADVTFSQSAADDLVITLSDGETITIENHFEAGSESLEGIKFADGTVLDVQGIQDKVGADSTIPASDDIFVGTTGSDLYQTSFNEGNDQIQENSTSSGEVDRLEFGAGITVADIYAEYVGDDLKISHNTLDGSISIIDDGNDKYYSDRYQINEYAFSDGTVLNRQEFLVQVLGTAGDDTFNSSGETDTFSFLGSEGNDSIVSNSNNSGETDRIKFGSGITVADIYAEYVGDDLRITHSTSGGSISIIGDGNDKYYSDRYQIEAYEFADGTVLNRLEFLEQVLGTAGNDTFNSSGETDTFSFNGGEGDDSIVSNSNNSGEADRIKFGAGITTADIYAEYVGDDLKISHNSLGGSISIIGDARDQYYADRYQIEAYEFSDGTVLNRQEFLEQILGTAGDDTFNSSGESDTFTFRGGEGDDSIVSVSNNSGETDRIKFGTGVTVADLYAEYVGDDLKISHSTLGGSISVTGDARDQYYADRYQIEVYEFSDGTSLTRQQFLEQVLGTAGDDTYNGSGESDTFHFSFDEGNDQIVSNSANSGETDTLIFGDTIVIGDLTSTRTDVNNDGTDDLMISHASLGGSISIISAFASSNAHRHEVDQFVFNDGSTYTQADFFTATDDPLS